MVKDYVLGLEYGALSIVLLIPIVLFIIFKRKGKIRMPAFMTGVLSYLFFNIILYDIINMALTSFIKNQIVLIALIILTLAIVSETGMFFFIRRFLKDRRALDGYAVGIGFTAMSSLSVAIGPMYQELVLVRLLKDGKVDEVKSLLGGLNYTEENITSIISNIVNIKAYEVLLKGIGECANIIFLFFLCLLVYEAAVDKKTKNLYLSIIAYMGYFGLLQLFQSMGSIIFTFVLSIAAAVISIIYIVKSIKGLMEKANKRKSLKER